MDAEQPVVPDEGGERAIPVSRTTRPRRAPSRFVDAAAFEEAFGEPLSHALDLASWLPDDFPAMLNELRRQIRTSVAREDAVRRRIREDVFPRLQTREQAVVGGGVYRVTTEQLERAHRCVLLNGGVDACDGTVTHHDALPLTVIRVGACLVSYNGRQNHFAHQFYRHDFRLTDSDPIRQTVDLLERRRERAGVDPNEQRDILSELSRRGMMAYAERALLARESKAIWRMGHGTPMPVELFSGSGSMELFEAGLEVVRELVMKHRRFVFLPSAPRERALLTIGQALNPLEFAIVDSMESRLQRLVDTSSYYPRTRELQAERFATEVGSKMVIGLYRVSEAAPAMIFYAHVDHAAEAALIAMADSALMSHRGFPLLIDVADRFCQSTFGAETLRSAAQEAYADAGVPFRYMAEREGRAKG